MLGLLGAQLPWWVAGPCIGLCVVALYGLANARLGVSGAWLATVAPIEGWRPEAWRVWFLASLVAGCLAAAVLGPPVQVHGYGGLSSVLSPVALVPVLLLVGVALGYGARLAGGCTSGHGLSGCSAGSPDSLVATATLFGVAVFVTVLLHAVTGGRL
ncbi:MAG: YeeE/YedE family protein [Marmoricola sp.]